MRVFAVTSYGRHTPMTGGRMRRDHLLSGLAELGHEVDRLTLEGRPGAATGVRSVRAALDRSVVARVREADVVLLADVFTAPLAPSVRRTKRPMVLDLCDSPYRLLADAPRRTAADRASYLSQRAQLVPVMHGLAPMVDRLTYISEDDSRVDLRIVPRLPEHTLVPNGIAPELFELPLDGAQGDGYVGWAADWSYAPNRESLSWFAREVVPLLPPAVMDRFLLFGPQDPLRSLGLVGGRLRYGGFAPTLAGLYEGAAVLVAPVLRGAGMKNKVLEPLAAGRPVLTTPEGVKGLPAHVTECVDVADAEPMAFAKAVIRALETPLSPERAAQRRASVSRWTWRGATAAMESALVAAMENRPSRGTARCG